VIQSNCACYFNAVTCQTSWVSTCLSCSQPDCMCLPERST